MFNSWKEAKHRRKASEVRELGPALFRKLLSVKNDHPFVPANDDLFVVSEKPVDLQTVFNAKDFLAGKFKVILERPVDCRTVLERQDLHKAIQSARYDGRDLAVLEYLYANFERVASLVGATVGAVRFTICAAPIYALTEKDIVQYTGTPNNCEEKVDTHAEPIKGDLSAICAGLTSGGMCGGLVGYLSMYLLTPGKPMWCGVFSCLAALICGYIGARFFYGESVRHNSAVKLIHRLTTQTSETSILSDRTRTMDPVRTFERKFHV